MSAWNRPCQKISMMPAASAGSVYEAISKDDFPAPRPWRKRTAGAGREVEPDHFGISLAVAEGEIPPALAAAVSQRRPGTDPAALIATRWPQARSMIGQYVAAGVSKFVLRPAAPEVPFRQFLDGFRREVMPLQT